MIRQAFMVKNSLSASSVTLSPNTGESLKVTNIHCTPNAAVTEFLTLQINRQTVGYFHVGTTILNQLPFQTDDVTIPTIIEQLKGQGYDLSFPIAEGETLTISASNDWTRLSIEYEIYDAGDMSSDMPNGSKSEEYIFLNYGKNAAAISAAGYTTLSDVHNPVQFPNFPFGSEVPSKKTMEILGVGMCELTMGGDDKDTDSLHSTYLKFFRDREVLFDEDNNGLLVQGVSAGASADTTLDYGTGYTSIPYGGAGTYHPFKCFPEPILFEGGEELSVQLAMAAAGAGGTLAASKAYVCIPIRVKSA